VFYRFNRNRALQVGIRAVVSLVRTSILRHVRKYCRYLLCCSVLLGGFEHSGGEAGCFRFVWSAREVSLTAEA